MVNPEHFILTREQLEGRLRWYEQKYGPYMRERGLKNWKNLFRKPTLYEWTILIMLILGLFMGWAYQRDISECRAFLDDVETYACLYCGNFQETMNLTPISPTKIIANVTFNEDITKKGG